MVLGPRFWGSRGSRRCGSTIVQGFLNPDMPSCAATRKAGKCRHSDRVPMQGVMLVMVNRSGADAAGWLRTVNSGPEHGSSVTTKERFPTLLR